MLDVEREFYSDNLPALMQQYQGRFIVVKDRSIVGAFTTIDEALQAGARQFGLQPFLVRLVGDPSPEVSIPALTLGLLNANPSYAVRGAGNESAGPANPNRP